MGKGQYLDVLVEVRPGQEAYLPVLMASSQFDLTGMPSAACRYQIRVTSLGRSLALRETVMVGRYWGTVCLGAKRKTPELGAGLFSVSCKEDGVVFGEDI